MVWLARKFHPPSEDEEHTVRWEWTLGRVFKFVIVGQRACARPSSARKWADLLEPKRVE